MVCVNHFNSGISFYSFSINKAYGDVIRGYNFHAGEAKEEFCYNLECILLERSLESFKDNDICETCAILVVLAKSVIWASW